MSPLGYLIASTIIGFLASAAGVLVYGWQKRVDLDAMKEASQINEESEPIKLLKTELAKREAELLDIRAQDRNERTEYLNTLTSISRAMDEVASDLKSLREEERSGRAGMHQQLAEVDKRLIVIETRLEKPA